MKPITDPVLSANHPHKFLGIFGMLWITFLLVAMFTASKTFSIGPVIFTVAILAYPFTYVFADIFTEVYGYRVTRKIVWTGFFCITLASALGYVYSIIPSDPSFVHQEAFELIFKSSPVVALATILAFFGGELTNSFVLAKMKIATSGNTLWARLIGSTLAGQLVDNTIWFSVVYAGTQFYSPTDFFPLVASSVIFATTWEIIALPITYRFIAYIKKKEGLDTYDHGTNFSPFATK